MKKFRNAAIVVLLFVVSIISVFAVAGCNKDDGTTDTYPGLRFHLNSDDTYSVRGLPKASGILIIPNEYEGKKVASIPENGFSDTYAESIEVPTSITKIEQNAFTGKFINSIKYSGTIDQWKVIEAAQNIFTFNREVKVTCTNGDITYSNGNITYNPAS